MGLKVIGAGWGRTGTESLRKALEILGFGKCYHMFELLRDAQRVTYWEEFFQKRTTDFDQLFDGYQSAVDFPAAAFYKELMVQYPDAKVILSYRDPDSWYESASKTILKTPPRLLVAAIKFLGSFNDNLSYLPRINNMVQTNIREGIFHDQCHDREFMIKRYLDWVEEVKLWVPKDRLLVFEAKEGWTPLCQFLEADIPHMPYPKGNDSKEFKKRQSFRNIIAEYGGKK